MKTSDLYSVVKTVVTLLLLITFATACSNSTSGEEEEHGHADGFVLKMNGQIIIQQLPHQDLTGEFELAPGEETDLITIFFLDHDGDQFQPDDEDLTLGYEFAEEGIAEFEQHGDDGKWSFHLHAESEGITELSLKLIHNGEHSDFTSQPIHVHVEEGN